MIGINNADSSFFAISSPAKKLNPNMTQDVISFSVTEEMGKAITGSLKLYDPNYMYSSLDFHYGTQLEIAWGYKKSDTSPQAILAQLSNPGEFKGNLERRGLRAIVTSISGDGSETGISTISVNFMGITENLDKTKRRNFSTGTKGTLVNQLLVEMGVDPRFVIFSRQNEALTPDTAERQDSESNLRMLTRLASWYGAIFRIGFDQKGGAVAIFADPDKIDKTPFNAMVGGGVGNNHLFEWKNGIKNVIRYSWRIHEGESGAGDNVRWENINGKPTMIRSVTSDEKVTDYVFRSDLVEQDFKRQKTIANKDDFVQRILKAQSTTEKGVSKYFEPYVSRTAPQGSGYTITCATLGNPLFTSPNKVKFGQGFPPRLQQFARLWYMRRVTHTVDATGYKNDIEIEDLSPMAVTVG